jgi:hypothetical protein
MHSPFGSNATSTPSTDETAAVAVAGAQPAARGSTPVKELIEKFEAIKTTAEP